MHAFDPQKVLLSSYGPYDLGYACFVPGPQILKTYPPILLRCISSASGDERAPLVVHHPCQVIPTNMIHLVNNLLREDENSGPIIEHAENHRVE